MKKVISLILSMVMVLSLTVLSFAEGETYSIKIENSTKGHTYEAYQIFTGDLSGSTLSNIQWGSGVNAATLGDAAAKAETLKTEADAKAFAEEIAPYLTTATNSTSTVTEFQNDTGATVKGYVIGNLPAGYYLVKDQNGSLEEDNDSYTSYILKVVKDTYAQPKSSNTTSEKKVKDINDSDGNGETGWQDSADYDIGDKVPFQLKGIVAANYDKYKVYKFAFHDKMSDGLTFAESSVEVFVDGTKIESGYQVVTTGLDDQCTFEVRFNDLKQISSVHGGSVITVEYKATLNENAKLGSEGNPNTSYLVYSNNPNDAQGGDTGKTPEDTVIVFTYKTIINKVDSENKPLTGAEFTLEKKYIENGEEVWKSVDVITTDAQDGTKDAVFTFKGLDDGDYKVTETKTPNGYNTINPKTIYFTVSATHDPNSQDPKLTGLTVASDSIKNEKGELVTGVLSFTADIDEGSLATNVVNKTGAELPETGGIGTTIFYVVGAVLVIGAGVLFITKRRMSTR